MNQLDELIVAINRFRDDRDWRKFHNAKDLALSLSLEASELLEHFQWMSADEAVQDRKAGLEEELGDVLIYALMLCSDLDLDPGSVIRKKLTHNAEKYPVDKAHGRREKYDRL